MPMENPTELYAVHVELVSVIDGIFEIWLGFSFATMVAFFMGAKAINRYIAAMGSLMYLFASYIFIVRFFHTASVINFLNDKIIEVGLDPYPRPDLPVPMGVVMLIGTAITVLVSIYTYLKQNRDGI